MRSRSSAARTAARRAASCASSSKKDRVYVEGLNIVKRHQRPTPGRPDAIAGVIEREGPIHVSNVMLLDPKDGKPTRIGIEVHEGTRFRVARRSGTRID